MMQMKISRRLQHRELENEENFTSRFRMYLAVLLESCAGRKDFFQFKIHGISTIWFFVIVRLQCCKFKFSSKIFDRSNVSFLPIFTGGLFFQPRETISSTSCGIIDIVKFVIYRVWIISSHDGWIERGSLWRSISNFHLSRKVGMYIDVRISICSCLCLCSFN